MRQCSSCGVTLTTDNGYRKGSLCRACNKLRSKAYHEANRSRRLKDMIERGAKCAEKKRRVASEWARSNRHRRAEIWAAYYAAKISAMPLWADRDAIEDVYRLAREKTLNTGVLHHVDHIVPLQGRGVRGLHVYYNLQVLPAIENAKKYNRLTELCEIV